MSHPVYLTLTYSVYYRTYTVLSVVFEVSIVVVTTVTYISHRTYTVLSVVVEAIAVVIRGDTHVSYGIYAVLPAVVEALVAVVTDDTHVYYRTYAILPVLVEAVMVVVRGDTHLSTGLNSRWQASQHRVYIYRQGRNLNLLSQLCSLLFLDFWLYFQKRCIHCMYVGTEGSKCIQIVNLC